MRSRSNQTMQPTAGRFEHGAEHTDSRHLHSLFGYSLYRYRLCETLFWLSHDFSFWIYVADSRISGRPRDDGAWRLLRLAGRTPWEPITL
jgi:hypothetical protein